MRGLASWEAVPHGSAVFLLAMVFGAWRYSSALENTKAGQLVTAKALRHEIDGRQERGEPLLQRPVVGDVDPCEPMQCGIIIYLHPEGTGGGTIDRMFQNSSRRGEWRHLACTRGMGSDSNWQKKECPKGAWFYTPSHFAEWAASALQSISQDASDYLRRNPRQFVHVHLYQHNIMPIVEELMRLRNYPAFQERGCSVFAFSSLRQPVGWAKYFWNMHWREMPRLNAESEHTIRAQVKAQWTNRLSKHVTYSWWPRCQSRMHLSYLECAATSFKLFDFVALLEHLPASLRCLQRKAGLASVDLGLRVHHTSNNFSHTFGQLGPQVNEQIDSVLLNCTPGDASLWHDAWARFSSVYEAYKPDASAAQPYS